MTAKKVTHKVVRVPNLVKRSLKVIMRMKTLLIVTWNLMRKLLLDPQLQFLFGLEPRKIFQVQLI